MVESGYETTPLLLDSLSPPTTSSGLSRRGGPYSSNKNSRQFRNNRSQVHPLHQSMSRQPLSSSAVPSTSYSSSVNSRKSMYSGRQPFPSAVSSYPSSSHTPSHQTISVPIYNKLWQSAVSLPHIICCFTSPDCSPVCGLCCCITCIRTSEFGVLEKFGKFAKILHPGMHILQWPMEREAGRISMRTKQLDINCETKSKDHVFLRLHVSIQYQINSTHLFESFYSMENPTRQLTTYVHDIIRSTLPHCLLDDIFLSQDSIALELHRHLNSNMNQYGYIIHHTLITKIWPNDHVKASMNEMEASKREKEAMPHKAEGVRIQLVKEAEAMAERAYLNGVGVSRERREIAMGMKDVAESISGSNHVVSTKGIMDLLLLTQYMDVLTDLNGRSKDDIEDDESGSSLFLTHCPETVSQLTATARECFGTATCDTVDEEKLIDMNL